MGRAEDAVRARMKAEKATAVRTRAAQVEADTASLMAQIEAAIPRILSGLEARGFPDARMIIVGSISRGVVRKRSEPVEMAGWLFYEYRNSDYHSEDYLLSDGRIFSGRSPYWVRQLPTMWEPEQVLHMLKLMWDGGPLARRGLGGEILKDGPAGIKGLLQHYGTDDIALRPSHGFPEPEGIPDRPR